MDPSDQQFQDSLRDKASVFITAPNNTPATNSFLSSLASSNALQSSKDPKDVNSELHKSLFAKLSLSDNEPAKVSDDLAEALEEIGERYNSLPENVYRRLRALRKLERSRIEHEISFITKLQSITETYNAKMKDYFEVRYQLLNSDANVGEGSMCPALRDEEIPSDSSIVKFPNFWPDVFTESSYFVDDDFEFLSFVEDIQGFNELPERDALVRAVETRRQLFETGQAESPNLKPEDIYSKLIVKFTLGDNPYVPAGTHTVTAFTDPFSKRVHSIKSDLTETYPAFNEESAIYQLLCPPSDETDDSEAYEIRDQLYELMNEIVLFANSAVLEYTGEALIDVY